MAAANNSKRLLVSGDVNGDLDKLYTDVERQQKQHGEFHLLFTTGKFLPSSQSQNHNLQQYVSGSKDIPIKTYFIDSDSAIFMKTAPNGRKLGKTKLEFLGAYGVKVIDGLRVAFLSGRYDQETYENGDNVLEDGRPIHVENFYTRAVVEQLKADAGDQMLDLLITSEWPEGLENNCGESAPPPEEFMSPAVTEICRTLEPRFHIFGLSGQFVRCTPYNSLSGKHVCRPVGLGKVNGVKGKNFKFMHALILVPGAQCNVAALKRGEADATPCPYEALTAPPVQAHAGGMKRGAHQMMAAPTAKPAKMPRIVQTPAGHKIRQDGMKTILDLHLGKGRHFSIETGEVFKQAGGAVVIRDGKTQVWGTTCASKEPTDKDFMPLSVEYKERSSGGGKTPGGFIKRDKPMCDEHEILVCRFTDRPLRPLFPEGWNYETQILLFTMCYDEVHPPEPLAICAAAASSYLSDIPLKRPIAGVMVSMTEEGEFIVNPDITERAAAKMNVMVAGTTEAVSMIEMSGDFVTEEQFLDAVMVGHEAIKVICRGMVAFNAQAGKAKRNVADTAPPQDLATIVDRKYGKKVDALFKTLRNVSNTEHEDKLSEIQKEAVAELVAKEGDPSPLFDYQKKDVSKCFKKMLSLKLMGLIKNTGFRPDGRRANEVRDISVSQRYLTECHGSSLFTRGDTQTIATATLGDSSSQQRQDSVVDPHKKRFYLQYFFPPSCVGDVRRMMKGRREVGHGNLAERAVQPSVPTHEEFPYTIRTESFITESCGSSSMASVCGASLAMLDAGVPVKCLVSGIAMGMVDHSSGVASEDAVILSDIAELEDFIGKMDFKVAGNETGISAVQLDVKNEGLTRPLFARALEQAKESRLHILDEMKTHVDLTKKVELPPNVPRILRVPINSDSKGKIIGPGGSNIRKLIAEFNLKNICVDDDDFCEVSGTDEAVLNSVKMIIEDICQGGGGPGGRMTNPNMPRLTITIPANGKGKLIGKGGSVIQGLIAEFNLADIKINDESNEVDIIGDDEDKREECKAKIMALYDQGPGGKGGKGKGSKGGNESQPDARMDVPRVRMGRIIGRGGEQIKSLISEFDLEDMKAREHNGEAWVELFGGSDDSRDCALEKIRGLIDDGPQQVGGCTPKSGNFAMRPPLGKGMRMAPQAARNMSQRPMMGKAVSNAPIAPKAAKAAGTGPQPKVSDELRKKLQMEFAAMAAGESKSYRLLPHEVKLAKDLAAAFEMPITQQGQDFIVTRPTEDQY